MSSSFGYSFNIDGGNEDEDDEELVHNGDLNKSFSDDEEDDESMIAPATAHVKNKYRHQNKMEVEFKTRRNGDEKSCSSNSSGSQKELQKQCPHDDFEVDKIVSKYFFSSGGSSSVTASNYKEVCRTPVSTQQEEEEEYGNTNTIRLSIMKSSMWNMWYSITKQREEQYSPTLTIRSPPPPPPLPKMKPRFSITSNDDSASANSYRSDTSNCSWASYLFTRRVGHPYHYYDKDTNKCCTIRLVRIVAITVLLLLLAVAVAVLVLVVPITNQATSPADNNNITSTNNNNNNKGQNNQFVYYPLSNLLQQVTSKDVLLQSTQSPQYRAMKWMIGEQDNLDVAVSLSYSQDDVHAVLYHVYQRYAMATLYFALGGNDNVLTSTNNEDLESFFNIQSGWIDSTNWLSSNSVCAWKGVTCDYEVDTDGIVNGIQLPKNMLDGTIPKEILVLKHLELLNLRQNSIKGSLPDTIGSCDSLLEIDMSQNRLEGSINELLDSLLPQSVTLQTLIFDNNNLYGSIVGEKLMAFDALRILSVSNNKISGALPSGMALPSSLLELKLDHNLFQGTLPSEWAVVERNQQQQQQQLIVFNVGCNKNLTGTIPDSFFQLFQSNLETLNLENTSISGTIPEWIHDLYSLEIFNLANTPIEGTISKQLGLLSASLRELDLGNTPNLGGTVPSELCKLRTSGELETLIVNCGGQTPTVQCDCCTECTASIGL